MSIVIEKKRIEVPGPVDFARAPRRANILTANPNAGSIAGNQAS